MCVCASFATPKCHPCMHVYRLTMATRAAKSTKLAHSASTTETETNRNRIQIRATLSQPAPTSVRANCIRKWSRGELSFFYAKEQSVLVVVVILFSQLEAQLLCVCAMTFRRLQELSYTLTHTQTLHLCCCRRAVHTPPIYMDIYSTYMYANLSSRRAPTEGRMQL